MISSTREVRGRIVRWHANEQPVLRRYTLSISSHIFLVLLVMARTQALREEKSLATSRFSSAPATSSPFCN